VHALSVSLFMHSIFLSNNENLKGIREGELFDYIMTTCQSHYENSRALAFCFIIYDFKNPQILKILEDFKLWKALDTISGKFLTLFYTQIREENLTDDLIRFNGMVTKDMHGVQSSTLAKLQHFIEYKEEIQSPVLLFFQSNGQTILDAFIVKLKEKKVEDAYLEIEDYISSAVDALKKIDKNNEQNIMPIFEMVKLNVQSEQRKKAMHKFINKFPMQQFIGWLVGKV
jgi:hypothetical protein